MTGPLIPKGAEGDSASDDTAPVAAAEPALAGADTIESITPIRPPEALQEAAIEAQAASSAPVPPSPESIVMKSGALVRPRRWISSHIVSSQP